MGGAIALADPEVFMIEAAYSNGGAAHCSGALTGARTLLTAAHCVDPRVAGATGVSLRATNVVDVAAARPEDWIAIELARTAPGWEPFGSLEHDLALALLETPPEAPQRIWNRASVDAVAGERVRAVGYGVTSKTASDWGVRRQVSLSISSVGPSYLYLGGEGEGICHGDSGGPTLMEFSDGVERVIGVHSYDANQKCTSGVDVRVDAYAGFIVGWMAEHEAENCVEPCVPVDCVENGVCAVEACPAPDPDCIAPGERCERAEQCRGRLCISDPQHPETYCSQACAMSAQCPSGMECSVNGECRLPQLPVARLGEPCESGAVLCDGELVCAGPAAGQTRCARGCAGSDECGDGRSCEAGVAGVRYCRPESPPRRPDPVLGPALPAEGCSTAGAGPWMPAAIALAAWGLMRRRSRLALLGTAARGRRGR